LAPRFAVRNAPGTGGRHNDLNRNPRHGDGIRRTACADPDGGELRRPLAGVYSPATLYLGFVCVGFVLLVTPSGSLPSPGARLRDQVDLDTLTADLLAVVDQTMQPTGVSLWLGGDHAQVGHLR
jgi:hypothetical protein